MNKKDTWVGGLYNLKMSGQFVPPIGEDVELQEILSHPNLNIIKDFIKTLLEKEKKQQREEIVEIIDGHKELYSATGIMEGDLYKKVGNVKEHCDSCCNETIDEILKDIKNII